MLLMMIQPKNSKVIRSFQKKPEDLEHADFLLGDHPKAARALDNLLGTQGWRRFAEQNPAQFVRMEKEDAEKLKKELEAVGAKVAIK